MPCLTNMELDLPENIRREIEDARQGRTTTGAAMNAIQTMARNPQVFQMAVDALTHVSNQAALHAPQAITSLNDWARNQAQQLGTRARDALLTDDPERNRIMTTGINRYETPPIHQLAREGQLQVGISPQEPAQKRIKYTAENMSTAMDTSEPTEAARATNDSGRGGMTTNTTKIDNIPPSFPFHNTVTAILEYTGSLSACRLVKTADTSNILRIRMNTYNTIMTNCPAYVPQASVTAPAQGLANSQIGRYGVDAGPLNEATVFTNYHRPLQTFLDNIVLGTAQPSMALYYNKLYSAYTVLSCRWKIKIDYPYHALEATEPNVDNTYTHSNIDHRDAGGDTYAAAYATYAVTGDSITPTNMPEGMYVDAMETYKGWVANANIPLNGTQTITGEWTPMKVKHNVLNDSDIDTWTATGTDPTSGHLEHLDRDPQRS